MKIWVDADACPKAIREILERAAVRRRIPLTLVANHALSVTSSPFIKSIQVTAGFDVADREICDRIEAGDLVITSDIPLAADVIERGGHCLSPRGELFSPDTIKARLNMRDFMNDLRGSGIHQGGPPPLGQRERQSFANQLDTLLTRYGGS